MEIINILIIIFGCVISYLLGGVSVARIITSKKGKGGITSEGSGNPGTMNMLRNHGIFMGVLTLICDALKGAIPALFGLLYFRQFDEKIAYIALFLFGLCAVVGHIFPIYYKFKGGKGIATTIGVFMVADPITSLILFGILVLTLYFIKIGSVVSMLFITINAIVQFFRDYTRSNWVVIVLICFMVILDISVHRQNLERLVENRENPADLQEGLKKDIDKIKNRRQKKLQKNEQKQDKIEKKYDKKIEKKHNSVNKKLNKVAEATEKQVQKTENAE